MTRVNAAAIVDMLKVSASSCGSNSASGAAVPPPASRGGSCAGRSRDPGTKRQCLHTEEVPSPLGCFLASAKVICLENQSLAFALSIH